MKISLAVLVLVTVIQLCTSNVLSKRGIQELSSSAGNKEINTENGTNVILTETGPLDVILGGNELVFEVCEFQCNSEFLVCFESDINGSYSVSFCDSKCGFYVNTNINSTTFMEPFIPKKRLGRRKLDKCTELSMKGGRITAKNELIRYNSCHPKIQNGIVKLNIMNATDCPVTIKNAKIKQAKVVTQAGNSVDSGDGSDDTSAANYIGNIGWISVLILFCILRCTTE